MLNAKRQEATFSNNKHDDNNFMSRQYFCKTDTDLDVLSRNILSYMQQDYKKTHDTEG